jgi:hypothetical protein
MMGVSCLPGHEEISREKKARKGSFLGLDPNFSYDKAEGTDLLPCPTPL